MATLTRGTWPGNAQQLLEVLREVVRHRRTGAIQPEDLPPSVRSVSRRHLNLIEAMQRDAVVQALADAERRQDPGGPLARHVPGDDLPQDPRLRDRPDAALIRSDGPACGVRPEVTGVMIGEGVRARPGNLRSRNLRDA